MKTIRILLLLGLTLLSAKARAFFFLDGMPWPDGPVLLELQLGNTPIYSDGTTPNTTAFAAVEAWNPWMGRVQLGYVYNSTAAKSNTNGKNNVFFNTKVYGTAFSDGVLAVTVGRIDRNRPIEMDIVVNQAISWDSYRGELQTKMDLQRVLAHEMGHVLGLDHPDEHGEHVVALMNSVISDVDTTMDDDKTGVTERYGRGIAGPPPVLDTLPVGGNFIEGQSHTLIAAASGPEPITFQWYKNGTVIAGATRTSIEFPFLRPSDAGRYTVRASNRWGFVNSPPAVLSVEAARIPVFTNQMGATMAVMLGGGFVLGPTATSNVPISYQWMKNGAPIPGATLRYLEISDVTAADFATYHVVATTIAGSVASDPCTISEHPGDPPTIRIHPVGGTAYLGESFSLMAFVDSNLPVTLQWIRDGVALPGRTRDSCLIEDIQASDAGVYWLIATNALGQVTTRHATLTVEPAPAPQRVTLHDQVAVAGTPFQLVANEAGYSGFTFRWYKDGVVVPGAMARALSVEKATFADSGDYFVVVTNAAGAVASNTAKVTVIDTVAEAWLDAQEADGVVYFLRASRVDRFELAAERWLPSVALSGSALAFAVENDAHLVVAYPDRLSRVAIATGEESVVSALSVSALSLVVHDGRAYLNSALPFIYNAFRLASVDLQTGTQTWSYSSEFLSGKLSFDPVHTRLITTTWRHQPNRLGATALEPAGAFGQTATSSMFSSVEVGPGTSITPDGQFVCDNAGNVHTTSDLTYAGSIGGAFSSVAFGEDGSFLVLRGAVIDSYDASFNHAGLVRLERAALHLTRVGQTLHSFSRPTSPDALPGWEKHALSEMTTPPLVEAVAAAITGYSAEDIALDRDGTLLLFSKVHGNIFRWSTTEQRYLEPIRLHGRPDRVAYVASVHSLFTAYADGRLGRIDLAGALQERFLVSISAHIHDMIACGDLLVVSATSDRTCIRIFDTSGRETGSLLRGLPTRLQAWDPVNRRLFFLISIPGTSPMYAVPIDAAGVPGPYYQSPEFVGGVRGPLRPTPDGARILDGEGHFFRSESFLPAEELPQSMLEATWLGDRLFTVRDTLTGCEINHWNAAGEADAVRGLSGHIVRLLPVPADRLVAVTEKGGRTAITLLNAELNVRTHFEDTPDLTRNHLANLSTRGRVGTGDSVMIAGFVVNGTAPKRVLVRAIGPSLHALGVSGELANPTLNLVDPISGAELGSNNDWTDTDGDALRMAFTSTGAFALPDGSRDAALIADLAPGRYTALVSGRDDTQGIALVETYDLDAEPGERRLINISTRAEVGVGDAVLIPGLVVQGAEPKRLLIRAVGPGLHIFGLQNRLPDPQLRVMNRDQELILANDNWGEDNVDVIRASSATSGAFALDDGSRDAALVATLDPGIYTVVVSGVDDATGIALVEVYEVP